MNKKMIVVVILVGIAAFLFILTKLFSIPRQPSVDTISPTLVPITRVPNPISEPDINTFQGTAQKQEDQFQKNTHPDLYLANRVPYETAEFRIDSQFRSEPVDHFTFFVSAKTQDTTRVRNLVVEWLYTVGLTDQQISSLEITYP